MTTSGGAATTPSLKFWIDQDKPVSMTASVTYEKETYYDVRDSLAFGLKAGPEKSGENWIFVMTRRTQLMSILTKAIAKRQEL